MRLDGNLNATVEHASNQIWHAQQRLDDPDYMETLVKNSCGIVLLIHK